MAGRPWGRSIKVRIAQVLIVRLFFVVMIGPTRPRMSVDSNGGALQIMAGDHSVERFKLSRDRMIVIAMELVPRSRVLDSECDRRS